MDLPVRPGDLQRFLTSFIIHHLEGIRREIGSQRPATDPGPTGTGIGDSADFRGAPLFFDSLELVTISSLVADTFFIHESGLEDLLLARPTLTDWSQIILRSLAHYDEKLSFFTSGSGGRPKNVTHRSDHLLTDVRALEERLDPGTRNRMVSLVPPHHIYGFIFSVLIPAIAGLEVLDLQPGSRRFASGDFIIATPAIVSQWRARDLSFPQDIVVSVSSAPFPEEDFVWLLDRGVQVWEIFGSTETGTIGTRRHPADPFEIMPFWNAGTGELLRDGSPKPVALNDRLRWIDERRFFPAGRLDEIVQINGHNVSPRHVAEILSRADGIADAAVRPYHSPSGLRLKAFIVPDASPGHGPQGGGIPEDRLIDQLRSYARHALADHERPSDYRIGDKLPVNSMGKAADWSIDIQSSTMEVG
jgi:long-chain acyl-CoA synthetase